MKDDPGDAGGDDAHGSRGADGSDGADASDGAQPVGLDGAHPSRLDGGHVQWRAWSAEAFEAAAAADQPILLSLVAAWSSECREADELTYGEPRIAAAIDDGFVPVRVDVDRQPRVARRYGVGGVPSVAFLTPDGEIVTAAGPLGPDGMRGAIEGVRRTWEERGSEAGRVPRELVDQEPPGGELDVAIESHMVEVLRENHDERAGGWGSGAKFPLPRTIEFALKRERETAERTLAAVQANLLDDVDGGFHRAAENADWSGLRTEKVLDANASLVRAFANAYRYTGEASYRDAASRGVEFLTTTLWTDAVPGEGGAFAASQAGDAAYFESDATDRADASPPAVDRTAIADWNALAVDALLTHAALTDDESARGFARRALGTLCEHLVEGDEVVHFAAPAGEPGSELEGASSEPVRLGSEPERGLLLDHARVVRALVTARSVLGAELDLGSGSGESDLGTRSSGNDPVQVARSLADHALAELQPGDSFVDGPASGPGLLDRPLRPLDANAELADALLDLHAATGEARYREAAHGAVAAFAGAHERFGPQAAHFASVAARLREGVLRIDVATPAGSDLHRAALRVADHEAVVLPAAGERDESYEDGAAYVVADGAVSAPARSPAELDERVGEVR